MSRKIDTDFGQRLKQATDNVGIPYSQTAIGTFLSVRKQNVDAWMNGTLPRADQLFVIADKLKVDPRWLATGETANKITNTKIPDGFGKKAEKILAVVRTLLHTDDESLEEIVAGVQALGGENGANGNNRHRAKKANRA